MGNYVMSVCVDEDSNVYNERVNMGKFKYLWNVLEGKKIEWNCLSKEEVLEELEEFVKSVEEGKEVDKKKFERVVKKFKRDLDNIDGNEGEFMLVNSWGVEYDMNFSLVYGVFNDVRG